MSSEKWVMRWRSWIAPKPSKPGVWRRKEGGFLVRGRAVDARTGKMREVKMNLLDVEDAGLAYDELQRELRKARAGMVEAAPTRTRLRDFAVSLLERKVQSGEIKSAKTRQIWGSTLERHILPAFGDFFVDQIRWADIEAWRGKAAEKVQAGTYKPHTVNDWLSILRVIINTAVAELELDRNPIAGVKNLDTSEHPTYTEEEPNSLTPAEVPMFLAAMRELHPKHFAMVALGFATGLRPSSLRPLRRKGSTPDVLWDDGALLVRRSQTRLDEVMETTKTKIRQRIALPSEMMDILRWHAETLPEGKMRESDLLFPSTRGKFRSGSCLNKPFREAAKQAGITKHLSPRAMRRTFQDLARAAEVKDVVTRAVSGHATESMQRHYSTVNQDEIRAGLAKVVSLAGFKKALETAAAAAATAPSTDQATDSERTAVAGGSGGAQGGAQGVRNENGR